MKIKIFSILLCLALFAFLAQCKSGGQIPYGDPSQAQTPQTSGETPAIEPTSKEEPPKAPTCPTPVVAPKDDIPYVPPEVIDAQNECDDLRFALYKDADIMAIGQASGKYGLLSGSAAAAFMKKRLNDDLSGCFAGERVNRRFATAPV